MAAGKERYEIFAGGKNGLIEDFRRLEIIGGGSQVSEKKSTDKGFERSISSFVTAVVSGAELGISETELIETTAATIAALESLRLGKAIRL